MKGGGGCRKSAFQECTPSDVQEKSWKNGIMIGLHPFFRFFFKLWKVDQNKGCKRGAEKRKGPILRAVLLEIFVMVWRHLQEKRIGEVAVSITDLPCAVQDVVEFCESIQLFRTIQCQEAWMFLGIEDDRGQMVYILYLLDRLDRWDFQEKNKKRYLIRAFRPMDLSLQRKRLFSSEPKKCKKRACRRNRQLVRHLKKRVQKLYQLCFGNTPQE